MTRTLRLTAPAKINWSLEVLRIRPDGYHEIRSVLQTIGLCDIVTLEESDGITLDVTGETSALADLPPEANLAWRAAVSFQALTRTSRGVRIRLEKHIPVAAGLGGGSSDAAAVLRGLNVLWSAGKPDVSLIEIAGEIGSDPRSSSSAVLPPSAGAASASTRSPTPSGHCCCLPRRRPASAAKRRRACSPR